ncbi:MAG: methylated-DNA--[protein]-cysteine S-methyltransferase [Halobacteriales archaeon]
MDGIYAREAPYLERFVQFGYAQGKVLRVTFPPEPDDGAGTDHPLLDRIDAYLEGERETFDDVEVALTVATDGRSVLETLRGVPYGESVGVEQLARMTPGLDAADEDDHATVREALADNPAPLLIPDHRVRDDTSGAPAPVEQKLGALEGV